MPDIEQVEEFENNGVVVLRNVFRDWIERLSAGVERNFRDPGPHFRSYTRDGDEGSFYGDYCNWQRVPEYREFLFHSPLGNIASRLMQSKTLRLFHEHVLVKEPGTSNKTPWHQDQPYYCVDGRLNCSFWIPLDPVPKATCPEFILGSHQWGRTFRPKKFVGHDYDHSDPMLEDIPDIDSKRAQYSILTSELEPGDAVAFNYMTVHGAPPNRSATHRRRAFAARLLGDDAVYATRSGEISPPFPGLEKRLKPGDPISGDEFPVIWPTPV